MDRSDIARTVNLRLLEQYEVLMHERHVSRAADRLGVTQSTVSTGLAKMRKVFEDPLLIRTAKGMVPTPKGLEVATRIRHALSLFEPSRFPEETFQPSKSTRRFKVIASEGLAQLFAPLLAGMLRAQAPHAQLSIQPADMRHTVESLRDQECDVAIGNVLLPPSELRKQLLFPQKICCIVSANHPVIRSRLTLKLFRAYPHVLWGSDLASLRAIETSVANALDDETFRSSAMRVPNILHVPAVVAVTDMIATIPSRIADDAMKRFDLRKLAPPMKLPNPDISMYWHELMHRDPAHVWFRSLVTQVAKISQGNRTTGT